ncbi:MAG: hypothetical protein KatS3mg068_0082 [Candidatus Sericytochromatia bacterium]|nr:MAG: hypothetical protein KatS3mg068_0082 [Candidatus Sericytochromatia bacterium]
MIYLKYKKRNYNDEISGEGIYFNLIPINPKKFFGNWNREFYKIYNFEDIITLDDPENLSIQFEILKNQVKEISNNLERKIDITILALGSGSIVNNILKNIDFFKDYISSITLSDLKEVNIKRWENFSDYNIKINCISGNLLDENFIKSFKTDLFYANELLGDLPNRFVYKQNGHLYDIRLGIYSQNRLPKLIKKEVKKVIKSIYYKGIFPKIFTPEIGKLLSFDIVYKRRIFNKELEYYFRLYPDNSVFAICDDAIFLIHNLYKQLNKDGKILLNDYGFFSFENLHLIHNFLREDNKNNNFVRNYYGEFTTEPALELMFFRLKKVVKNINITKTIDLLSKIINFPRELINLDGDNRNEIFFYEKILERLNYWKINYTNDVIFKIISEYIIELKEIFFDNNWQDYLEKVKILAKLKVNEINLTLNNKISEERKITLEKILLGFFNDDDHRFLTIIIEK